MSHKLLLVGDPHVTVSELEDSEALLRLVELLAATHSVDGIVFLGDQHHTHEIVHQEVMDFWKRWLSRLGLTRNLILLAGNHDRSHNLALETNTLWPYDRLTTLTRVVHHSHYLGAGVGLISWTPDEEEFRELIKDMGASLKTLICHQTFSGGKYDNGFYAPDGFLLSGLEGLRIISGHIHTPQEFANVWYPGAPRWRTRSDVNIERGIWVVGFDDEGAMISRFRVDTAGHCKQMVEFDMYQDPVTAYPDYSGIRKPVDITLNLHGSQEWIDITRQVYEKTLPEASRRLQVRTFPTKATRASVRESDGLTEALAKHVEAYQPQFGTEPERLKKLVTERVQL